MARLRFSIATEGAITLVGAAATTILQIKAPANQDIAIRGFAVSGDGASGAAIPGVAELRVQTQALQGTGGSAATACKDDPRISTTVQTTGLKWITGTTEPTDGGAGGTPRDFNLHPQTGVEFRYWLDEEIIVAHGTWIGLRVTMPAAVDLRGRLFCEE